MRPARSAPTIPAARPTTQMIRADSHDQPERRGQPGADQGADVLAELERPAEVEVQHPGEPVPVLRQERVVEAVLRRHRRRPSPASGCGPAEEGDRVAGREVERGEDQERGDEERRDHAEQPPHDEPDHAPTPSEHRHARSGSDQRPSADSSAAPARKTVDVVVGAPDDLDTRGQPVDDRPDGTASTGTRPMTLNGSVMMTSVHGTSASPTGDAAGRRSPRRPRGRATAMVGQSRTSLRSSTRSPSERVDLGLRHQPRGVGRGSPTAAAARRANSRV